MNVLRVNSREQRYVSILKHVPAKLNRRIPKDLPMTTRSIEKRNKLLELACVWSDAAQVEEQFATAARPLSPQVA
jgi:hypothetical protein